MIFLRRPNSDSIRLFVNRQAKGSFTYEAVGATASTPPAGFTIDHTRVTLGEGEAIFKAAKAALETWTQFDLGWLQPCSREVPIKSGEVVAVLARAVGGWWLNACRIVYVVDESGPITKFGFAYGTLPGHAESGEERFLIEWNHADNRVWYDILAFSRPRHFLARLGYPVVRRMQKRFGRESSAALLRAVQNAAR